jgi:hypothetical protein
MPEPGSKFRANRHKYFCYLYLNKREGFSSELIVLHSATQDSGAHLRTPEVCDAAAVSDLRVLRFASIVAFHLINMR